MRAWRYPVHTTHTPRSLQLIVVFVLATYNHICRCPSIGVRQPKRNFRIRLDHLLMSRQLVRSSSSWLYAIEQAHENAQMCAVVPSSLAVKDERVRTKWPLDILHERERARWAQAMRAPFRTLLAFICNFSARIGGSGICCEEVKPKVHRRELAMLRLYSLVFIR